MTDQSRPTVAIIILTYEPNMSIDVPERDISVPIRGTAYRTLDAALRNIHYSGPLRVHIADDGSDRRHVEMLRELAGGYANVVTVGDTNAARRGYGASYNLATQAVHDTADIILPLEDDWELQRALDLDPLVDTLAGGLGISCIRLGYLGFTQTLYGDLVHTPAGPMILFDPTSNEPHIAAGHPRLETASWERVVGPWPEGLAPGDTEFEWCQRDAARRGVAWPLNLGPASQCRESLFAHIGTVGLGEVQPEVTPGS